MTTPRYRQIDRNGRKADRLLIYHHQEMSGNQLDLLIRQSLRGLFARIKWVETQKNGWHAIGGMRVIEGGQGQ